MVSSEALYSDAEKLESCIGKVDQWSFVVFNISILNKPTPLFLTFLSCDSAVCEISPNEEVLTPVSRLKVW